MEIRLFYFIFTKKHPTHKYIYFKEELFTPTKEGTQLRPTVRGPLQDGNAGSRVFG